MKTKITSLLLFTLFCLQGSSQSCLPDGIVFTSQEQIDSFPINYPNCTEVIGSIVLDGTIDFPIFSMDSLYQITEIGGSLWVKECILLNGFRGLNNVTTINGSLKIHDVSTGPLEGVENLTTIGGDLILNNVFSNTDLFSGFNSLLEIGGNFTLYSVDTPSLEGLENLQEIKGSLNFQESFLNTIEALSNLTYIGNGISIEFCNGLNSLDGLENVNLDSISSLNLSFNFNLSYCHLDNICSYLNAGGTAYVSFNAGYCENLNLINTTCNSPCVFETILLTNQNQVDSFPILYPNCQELLFGLTIHSGVVNPIVNLDSLVQITEIMQGELIIEENELLTSLSGLSNLSSVQGGVIINENPMLLNLTGLDNLWGTPFVTVSNNDELTSLTGLEGIQTLITLTIKNNPSLLGFEGLQNLGGIGNLIIDNNSSVTNLSGLENIGVFGIEIMISNNASLETMEGMELPVILQSSVIISNNPLLQDLSAFGNTLSSFGSIFIRDNGSLTHLNDLQNLGLLNGTLELKNNDSLTSLEGLETFDDLTSGFLAILENDALVDISQLDNLVAVTISGLFIEHNPNLSICNLTSICDYLEQGNVGSFLENAPGCNSQTEVEIACGLINAIEEAGAERIRISPNPNTGTFRIENWNREKGHFKIYNTLGHLVLEGKLSDRALMDISNIPSGVYYISVFDKEVNFTCRILKQSN